MTGEVERIADSLKGIRDGTKPLIQLVEQWFSSDLDIEFTLKKGKQKFYCKFESDVWYEHINNNQGVTVRSIRHNGNHRRFIGIEGSDKIFEDVYRYCHALYTKDELIDLIHQLSEDYRIVLED